ncbi:MAG: GAF domain-containing protein [Methanoregulaceae archaeon]|nr:GAF domain-containing protein [Methanoregulaceae archaeon]
MPRNDGSLTPYLLATQARSEELLLREIAKAALVEFEIDACDIFLKVADMMVLRSSTTAPEFVNRVRLGPGVGLCGRVFDNGKAMFVERGVENLPDYARYPGIDHPDWQAAAILPFEFDGRRFGVAMLRHRLPKKWPASMQGRLGEWATGTATAVAIFDHAHTVGTQTGTLGALSDVSRTIASSPYIEEILQLLVNLTAQRFNYIVVTVRLLDEEHQELVLRATQAPAKAYAKKRAIKLGESIAGKAIAENRPVVIPDVQVEASYIGHELAIEQGMRSMICVPLTIQDRAVGVMSCYTDEIRDFAPEEIAALETLAKQAAISIEHAKLQVRSTLMQEMHHRVKNNLQQVASLLRLQLRHGHYKSLEEAINDSLARILAISSVHDLLSREDLDHVGIRSIAEMLVQHQKNSLILPDRRVRFDVRGDDVRLDMAQATQVALLINELIQNAVEHGFHETMEGEIHVTVERSEHEVSLWVSNSGDPLPEDFEPVRDGRLGIQIVENLARALGGKFKISNILGWAVAEVKFPHGGLA